MSRREWLSIAVLLVVTIALLWGSGLLGEIALLELTGPDGQHIAVNPAEIVAVRAPRRADHFADRARCLVFTSDGKFLAVVETCEDIDRRVKEGDHAVPQGQKR